MSAKRPYFPRRTSGACHSTAPRLPEQPRDGGDRATSPPGGAASCPVSGTATRCRRRHCSEQPGRHGRQRHRRPGRRRRRPRNGCPVHTQRHRLTRQPRRRGYARRRRRGAVPAPRLDPRPAPLPFAAVARDQRSVRHPGVGGDAAADPGDAGGQLLWALPRPASRTPPAWRRRRSAPCWSCGAASATTAARWHCSAPPARWCANTAASFRPTATPCCACRG